MLRKNGDPSKSTFGGGMGIKKILYRIKRKYYWDPKNIPTPCKKTQENDTSNVGPGARGRKKRRNKDTTKFRNEETKKRGNEERRERRNEETKTRGNEETKERRNEKTNKRGNEEKRKRRNEETKTSRK